MLSGECIFAFDFIFLTSWQHTCKLWNHEQQHAYGHYEVYCVLSAVKLDNKASRINVRGSLTFRV